MTLLPNEGWYPLKSLIFGIAIGSLKIGASNSLGIFVGFEDPSSSFFCSSLFPNQPRETQPFKSRRKEIKVTNFISLPQPVKAIFATNGDIQEQTPS